MPLNIPVFSENDFSFGPGILYIGAAGSTPTEDVGAIGEDGVQIEITSEKKTLTQGNPKLSIFTFTQAQGVMIKLTSIEWDFRDMTSILGAGLTTSAGGQDTFAFGGDPLVSRVALRVEHQMAVSGNTLYANVWRAVSEGGLNIALGQDEHQFAQSYMGHRTTTDWAGAALDFRAQLFQLVRVTA